MKNILIIGATSAIAESVARVYARRGDNLHLAGRNEQRLKILVEDLRIRGAKSVGFYKIDVNEFENHRGILDNAFETLGEVDIILIAHGSLPDQEACESDFEVMLKELNTNAISTISLLTHVANKLETQGRGTVAVITSVAGDRGRQSNYVYGAAKGMVSIFLQGLRNRLYKSGVSVVDIKPGFVDTPMTSNFEKGILWAKPEAVALDIVSAVDHGKDVIYTPFFWRLIMIIIRGIPEFVFKRLSL